MTPLLLGLGLDEFSMTSRSIPLVKRVIRAVTMADCTALAERALAAVNCKQVSALLRDWRREHVPDYERLILS
jgi:phosphotransferase system enzyme I (PtsI)